MSERRSEVCADEPRLVICAVEAKEPGPEQLATRRDRTEDDEDLSLIDGCVLEMGVDEATGQRTQVRAMLGKGRCVRFGCVLGRDPADAEIELQRPTLCVQQVAKGLDRPRLLLRRQALKVQRAGANDDARCTTAKSNDAAIDGGDLVAEGRSPELFDHRSVSRC